MFAFDETKECLYYIHIHVLPSACHNNYSCQHKEKSKKMKQTKSQTQVISQVFPWKGVEGTTGTLFLTFFTK